MTENRTTSLYLKDSVPLQRDIYYLVFHNSSIQGGSVEAVTVLYYWTDKVLVGDRY